MTNFRLSCPKCREHTNIKVEKRPNGNAECLSCRYSGPYVQFMRLPDKPFVRSEIDCIDGKECWALTLRLATNTCYRKIKEHFDQVLDDDNNIPLAHVNLYLSRKGYTFIPMSQFKVNDVSEKLTIKKACDIFKDMKVVIRSTCDACCHEPNIHFFENGILYTSCTRDTVFNEEVLNIWIRI